MSKQDTATLAQAARIVVMPQPGDGSTLEERVAAVLETEPLPAYRYFALQIIGGVVEDELDAALFSALGIDYHDTKNWPCRDITYDYYDTSFELKDTREDWEPSPEGLAKAWALGFSRCWICYGGAKFGPDTDPNYHEKYYWAGSPEAGT